MMKKKLKIPQFNNEDQERDFWSRVDLADYFKASDFGRTAIPNLKFTTRPTRKISVRMPQWLLACLKELASVRDVPYQSLMKMFLADRVKKELKTSA